MSSLRLPGELRDMFREWLQVHYPDRLKRAVSLMQSMREGKDYEAQWGRRMAGSGPYAWMIGRRFEMAARRLGYRETSRALRTDLFVSRRLRRATLPPSSACFDGSVIGPHPAALCASSFSRKARRETGVLRRAYAGEGRR